MRKLELDATKLVGIVRIIIGAVKQRFVFGIVVRFIVWFVKFFQLIVRIFIGIFEFVRQFVEWFGQQFLRKWFIGKRLIRLPGYHDQRNRCSLRERQAECLHSRGHAEDRELLSLENRRSLAVQPSSRLLRV